jgi:pimeloyl-ACP methyl ester carboxylesterase
MPSSGFENEPLPIVFVPGLIASPRLYAEQIPALWRFGPASIALHTRDDSMAAIARRILADAPARFALIGLSMGGYIAFEIMRQAPQRVARLALLNTSAQPDTPASSEARRQAIALTQSGRFAQIPDQLFPRLVHPSRRGDRALLALVRQMAEECGPEAFVRQQTANITRLDSRPTLATIRCPTLVLAGAQDELIPADRAEEIANGIAGARLVTVPDCGHLSTLEQPQEVTRALADWMDR